MRRGLSLLALIALGCAFPAAAQAAPDRWIVVLDDAAGDPAVVAEQHGRSHEARADHVYRHALRGYAGVIPAHKVDEVRRDSRVKYVEPDGEVSVSTHQVPWGIDRVQADLSSQVSGNHTGAVTGVTAYVIDSGIDTAHRDLLVTRHVNFAGGKNTDCNGHGTHVAGTIAAKDDLNDVVGVAPGAPLVGVKVLGCNGSGSNSGVIAGIDWVASNRRGPSVANMSLGGGASTAIDDAVRRLATSGVAVAVAAGNETTVACSKSPARAGAGTDNGIITVGATDSAEREASFSNHGTCVDFWAPGVGITSTRRGGGTTTMNGTSMASPHVAGGAVLALAADPLRSPAGVESALRSTTDATGTASRDGRAIRRLNVDAF